MQRQLAKYGAWAFLVLGALGIVTGIAGNRFYLILGPFWLLIAFGYAWGYRHPRPTDGRRDSVLTAHQKWRARKQQADGS